MVKQKDKTNIRWEHPLQMDSRLQHQRRDEERGRVWARLRRWAGTWLSRWPFVSQLAAAPAPAWRTPTRRLVDGRPAGDLAA